MAESDLSTTKPRTVRNCDSCFLSCAKAPAASTSRKIVAIEKLASLFMILFSLAFQPEDHVFDPVARFSVHCLGLFLETFLFHHHFVIASLFDADCELTARIGLCLPPEFLLVASPNPDFHPRERKASEVKTVPFTRKSSACFAFCFLLFLAVLACAEALGDDVSGLVCAAIETKGKNSRGATRTSLRCTVCTMGSFYLDGRFGNGRCPAVPGSELLLVLFFVQLFFVLFQIAVFGKLLFGLLFLFLVEVIRYQVQMDGMRLRHFELGFALGAA